MFDRDGTDPNALATLRASDPVLARLIDGLEPVDLSRWRARWSLDSFSALARAIVGQQIATAAAAAIFERLQSLIEVLALSQAWRPNRSLATAYLYSSLRGMARAPRERGAGRARP